MKKGIIILISIIIFCLLVYKCTTSVLSGFGSGSYQYAETWTINAKETDVLDAINDLSIKKSLFLFTDTLRRAGRKQGFYELEHLTQDGKVEKYIPDEPHSIYNSYGCLENGWKDYWYHIYFSYPDTKEIVYAWTRPSEDSSITTLALIGIEKMNKFDSYKLINKDYWYFSNKSEINKFNDSIVEKIKLKIQQNTKTL